MGIPGGKSDARGAGEEAPTPEKIPELREKPQITGHTSAQQNWWEKTQLGAFRL